MPGIDPERWRLLSGYLDQVLALTASDARAEWIRRLERDDPRTAADLRQLLDEHRALADERFLETSPPLRPLVGAGQTFGAYTLTAQIGRGGMGTVWLAERSDGRFQRQAAIKFLDIALGGDGEQRFRREAGILALLNHPNIAQLLDAGVAASGQPYLVLEYVAGVPIDRYCESLDVRARVRLFCSALGAVGHAHAHLIVHRDLKPPNILVDRTGAPKLLDFGIARMIDATVDPTMTLQRVLTPEYASPEQVRGLAPATTSDIYSLGAVLYRLLTGRSPHVAVPGSSLETTVCTTQPVPPRQISPGLSLDLESIVLKALRKEPRERYQSVEAFAEDLRAVLEHRPVRARSGNTWYHTRRFARRYWLPLATTAVVVFSLTTALLVAERQREIADRRFQELRQLATNVIQFDGDIHNLPGSTAARQRLVAISLGYLQGLAADASGDIGLMRELAEAYSRVARVQGVPVETNLGDTAAAEVSLVKADALIHRVIAARPDDRGALLRAATIAHDRMILAVSDRRDNDAIGHARDAAARLDRVLRAGALDRDERLGTALLSSNIALAYLNLHDYPDSVVNARRSIDLVQSDATARNTLAAALSVLASALRYEGDLQPALEAIRRARAIDEGARDVNPTVQMFNLYGVLFREGLILGEPHSVSYGRPDEAIEPLQKAVDLTEAGAERDPNDSDSRKRLASASRELGNIVRDRDPQRALALYEHAVKRLREIHGVSAEARHTQAVLLAESTYALRQIGRPRDAAQRTAEAVAAVTALGEYPPAHATLDSAVSAVVRAQADEEAAEGRLPAAIATYTLLLHAVDGSKPTPQQDLRNAAALSRLYSGLADLYRRSGDGTAAGATAERNRALWDEWNRKLPGNAFVTRQLAALASTPDHESASRRP